MKCPMDCHKKKQCCGIGFKSIPAALGDDTGEFKPENGAYHNMLIRYEANNALYIYSNDGIFTRVNTEADIPEIKDFVGATVETAGKHGLVPAPDASDYNKYLKGDGTWAEVSGGGGGEVLYVYCTEHYLSTTTFDMYSDAAKTTPITAGALLAAYKEGKKIRFAHIQNTSDLYTAVYVDAVHVYEIRPREDMPPAKIAFMTTSNRPGYSGYNTAGSYEATSPSATTLSAYGISFQKQLTAGDGISITADGTISATGGGGGGGDSGTIYYADINDSAPSYLEIYSDISMHHTVDDTAMQTAVCAGPVTIVDVRNNYVFSVMAASFSGSSAIYLAVDEYGSFSVQKYEYMSHRWMKH